MTSVIEQPTTNTPAQDNRLRQSNHTLKIVVVVLAIIALALGGVVIFNATTTDDSDSTMPAEVQQILDDFTTAMENTDYAAMQEVVTGDFRRPEYAIRPDGTNEYRQERDLEFYEREFGYDSVHFSLSTTGAPVVRGDGPWIVSVPQDWEQVGTSTKFEVIYTFAIVDRDGTLQIEDAYWAGIGPMPLD